MQPDIPKVSAIRPSRETPSRGQGEPTCTKVQITPLELQRFRSWGIEPDEIYLRRLKSDSPDRENQ